LEALDLFTNTIDKCTSREQKRQSSEKIRKNHWGITLIVSLEQVGDVPVVARYMN
jgi:hypothetical protein